MKNHALLFALLLPALVFSQTTEFPGTIKLKPSSKVYKVVTIKDCIKNYSPPPGSTTTTITYETKLKNDKTEITIESVVNQPGGSISVGADKVLKIPFDVSGRADLYMEEKDKSVLYVNYLLDEENTIKANSTIVEYAVTYDCNGNPTHTMVNSRLLTKDENFLGNIYKDITPIQNMSWFINSNYIQVTDSNGTIYYLVQIYDRNAKYILELQNREYIPYRSTSIDLGALTIPLKFRFGYSEGNINVQSDVSSSYNIGLYAGYKLTKYNIINKAGTYIQRDLRSLRIGPFINFSTATLDKFNTTAGEVPITGDEKQNIGVFSAGVGIMGDINRVQMGLYAGWDFGMGSSAQNWNYNKKFWLGIGVGYKITDLFAQKN